MLNRFVAYYPGKYQMAIANINEAKLASNSSNITNRLISLPTISPSIDRSALSGAFETLGTDCTHSTGCWQILDRCNRYLNTLYSEIKPLDDILCCEKDLLEPDVLSAYDFNLSSSIEGFQNSLTTFSLTDFMGFSLETFSLLSNFVHIALSSGTSSVLNDIDFDDNRQFCFNILSSTAYTSDYAALFLNQNVHQNLGCGLSIASPDNLPTNIAHYYDIYILLDSFIHRLKNIKKAIFSFDLLTSIKDSHITTYGRLSIDNDYRRYLGINIPIAISPYIETARMTNTNNYNQFPFKIDDEDRYLYINNSHYSDDPNAYGWQKLNSSDTADQQGVPVDNIYIDSKIKIDQQDNVDRSSKLLNLALLVYDVSSGASTPELFNRIDTKNNYSNGIFGIQVSTEKQDNFKLKLTDVLKLYNINKGQVISRKSILFAIDYIFNYWVEHCSYVFYNVEICHSNCHTNVYSEAFGGTRTRHKNFLVSKDSLLYFIGGCTCQLKLSDSIKFDNEIKQWIDTSLSSTSEWSSCLSSGTISPQLTAKLTKLEYTNNQYPLQVLNTYIPSEKNTDNFAYQWVNLTKGMLLNNADTVIPIVKFKTQLSDLSSLSIGSWSTRNTYGTGITTCSDYFFKLKITYSLQWTYTETQDL